MVDVQRYHQLDVITSHKLNVQISTCLLAEARTTPSLKPLPLYPPLLRPLQPPQPNPSRISTTEAGRMRENTPPKLFKSYRGMTNLPKPKAALLPPFMISGYDILIIGALLTLSIDLYYP